MLPNLIAFIQLRSSLRLAVIAAILILPFPELASAQAEEEATLRVLVIFEDDGTPVVGANILLMNPQGDTLDAGATDIYGLLEFSGIIPGSYSIQISFVGYESHRQTISLEPGETRTYKTALERSTETLDEVVVRTKPEVTRREAGKQTITAVTLDRTPSPGPDRDLTSYLQTLPGVVTTGDRGGELHIRGGTPTQNLVLVDNMPVIKPFHISNLFSAFPQDLISSVDMYAGGFGAEYTGATSAVLDINLRQGNMRRFSGRAAMSPYMASLRLEGPLKKDEHSFLFIGRHSTIEQFGPDLTGQDTPLLFSDMTARYSINWDGITCSITAMNTYDRGTINPDRDGSLRWTNITLGGRCLAYAEEFDNKLDITIGYSGYTSNEIFFADNGRSSEIRMGYLKMKTEAEILGIPFDLGLQWDVTRYNAHLDELFVDDRIRGLDSSLDVVTSILSGHFSVEWEPSRNLTITPGFASQVRQSTISPTFEPRLRLVWRPDGSDRQEISFATGRYIQMRDGISDERDAGSVFNVYKPVGNEDPLPNSVHGIIGYRRQISDSFGISLEGYAKMDEHIPVAEWTRQPGNTLRVARADGFTYGADIQTELDLYPFYISLGYGLASVTYEALTKDLVSWLDRPVFRFHPAHDRRHQLNIISSYELGKFTLSASWQFSSGNPFTRLLSIDQALNLPEQDPLADLGKAHTLYSEPFNARLPSFHRLDLSLERKFSLFPGVLLEAEIGAINAYDMRNVFYFDVNTLRQVDQMPLLPYVSAGIAFR